MKAGVATDGSPSSATLRRHRSRNAVLALLVGGCGAGVFSCHRPAPTPTPQPTAPPKALVPTSPSSDGKRIRIALIAKSTSNPSYLSAKLGAEDKARELAETWKRPIEIDWMTPPQDDAQLQAQRILQAVNERVDAILISSSDDSHVAAAINDAVSRGVEVMTFDSDAPSSKRFSFCGVDNKKLGRQVIQELVQVLPRKASVAILVGSRDTSGLQRAAGALEEAASHRDIKIVGTFFHPETATDAVAEVLRVRAAFPKVTGWAFLGGWPLYTKTLLTDFLPPDGKAPKHHVVSVNALPPQLAYVEKGIAPVLLAQPTYLWGAVGVQAIVDRLITHKTVPEIIPMELFRVTQANLGNWARQLRQWGFGDVPDEYLKLPSPN